MIPNMTKYYEPQAESVYTYDVAKAKELLAEAGYPDGFDLEITVPSSYSQHVDTAQIIADELSQAGVRTTIKQVEWSTWLEDEAVDDAEKTAKYKEAQMILAQDAAAVYIEDPANLVAVNKKFAGYTFYPTSAEDMSLLYQIAQ